MQTTAVGFSTATNQINTELGSSMVEYSRNVMPAPVRCSAIRQLGLMFEWQWRRGLTNIPLLIIVQTLMSVLTVFGYGMLIGTPPPQAARFLVTGAATVPLIMVGLVMVPQQTAQAKTEGSLNWLQTLPVPRWVFLFTDLLYWMVVAVPGTVLGLLLGAWHFGVSLSVTPFVLLAAPLVALVAATVGYSIALIAPPQVASLLSQVLVFVVLLFSPMSFPPENLPRWLAEIHQWLPIAPMASLMRSVLMSDYFSMTLREGIVLTVWTIVTLLLAFRALSRRV